jgi:hypothetical protein
MSLADAGQFPWISHKRHCRDFLLSGVTCCDGCWLPCCGATQRAPKKSFDEDLEHLTDSRMGVRLEVRDPKWSGRTGTGELLETYQRQR